MSIAPSSAERRRLRYRLRRVLVEAGAVTLGLTLLIWSLAPIYNMLLIALDPEEGEIEFTGNIWPPEISLDSFRVVLMQDDRYLEHFWRQFGNSLYIGLATVFLTVLIASMASFAVGRMRLGRSGLLTNAALLTYAVPASFLIFPFYRIIHGFGLSSSRASGWVTASGSCSCSAWPVLRYRYGRCRATSWAMALTAAYTHDW